MTTLVLNSSEVLQSRVGEGRIPRYGPMLMLVARSVFLLLAQGITFLILRGLSVQDPAVEVRNWWPVYGTLVDFGCLGLLLWLTRREGIRLLDLIGIVKSKLMTDIPRGLGLFIIIFPVTILGGGMLAMLIAYGQLNPVFPENTYIRTLPLLALLYSRILWWPLWSATEEMTYNGYALPRLIAMTKSTWLSVAIVSFFFAIQHSFLMLAGFQFGLYMFITFVPLTIAMQLAYLRIRRLPPLIVAHWLMDFTNVLFLFQVG
ncbi:MAG TPA: CPBP family intramembrane glutamic endopeptidase [Anaerolineales bacterium]|nr:CPBP family intramembrane glutamic endopeptidase [Anaerolineales bacterium]